METQRMDEIKTHLKIILTWAACGLIGPTECRIINRWLTEALAMMKGGQKE